MKRFIALILLLMLVVPVAMAEADFDFTGYSYDQLIGIKEQLDAEIATRPEAGARVLQPGQYVVGKDIAQGIYDVGFVPITTSAACTWATCPATRAACRRAAP